MLSHKLLQTLFYAPYSLLKYCLSALPDKHPASEYPYKIISIYEKKSTYYFVIQIANSRAIFKANLREVFMNSHILQKLTPFHVFKVGYYLKQNEINYIQQLKSRQTTTKSLSIQQKWISLLASLSSILAKTTSKTQKSEKGYYMLDKHYIDNGTLHLRFTILKTSMSFDIPFSELQKDFTLIKNISTSDLVNIGYILREKEYDIDTTGMEP